jgi:hypothetical protein
MPGKRLTEEKRRQVIAALTVNSNATAVAREVGGVSGVGVWKIAEKAGIELTAGIAARGCNNRVPPDKRAEIVAALNLPSEQLRLHWDCLQSYGRGLRSGE